MPDNPDRADAAGGVPGLPMEALIGAPLEAAARSNMMLARSTAEFIRTVGFDGDGNARVVDFKFDRVRQEEDGELVAEEVDIELPLIAVVPVPNLQIEHVDLTFDIEVKSHFNEAENSDTDEQRGGSSLAATDRFRIYGVTTAHREQARRSDTAAKYHLEIHAANRGMPEALARVMDMMAAAVAPTPGSDVQTERERDEQLRKEREAELTKSERNLERRWETIRRREAKLKEDAARLEAEREAAAEGGSTSTAAKRTARSRKRR